MNNNKILLTEENQHMESDNKTFGNFPKKKPDDLLGIQIDALFKISDPDSGETIVEGRA